MNVLRIAGALVAVWFAAFAPLAGADAKPAQKLPPLEQVLEQFYAAQGGRAYLASVNSVRVRGRLDSKPGKFEFILLKKRPNLVRMTVRMGIHDLTMAYDGYQAWQVLPGKKPEEYELMDPETAAPFMRDAPLFSHLIDAEKFGTKLQLLALTDVLGDPAYQIRATLKNGEKVDFYVDARTFLEVKNAAYEKIDGKYRLQETYYSDFRPVGELKVPYSVETVLDGARQSTMLVESMELNVGMYDRYFWMPGWEPPVVEQPAEPAPAAPAAK